MAKKPEVMAKKPEWKQMPDLTVTPEKKSPATRVCGMCGNHIPGRTETVEAKEEKVGTLATAGISKPTGPQVIEIKPSCSIFSGSYPDDSRIAETCQKFKEKKERKKREKPEKEEK